MKTLTILLFTLFADIFTGCYQKQNVGESVKKDLFGIHNGKEVYLLTLTNKAGNVIKLTNFGARITWIEVPDKNGKKENVTFGYDTFDETIKGDPYFGPVIGRYANRINKGKVVIENKEYNVARSHGGRGGWHSVVWNTEVIKDSEYPSVKFSYVSPDLEEGFPGKVNIDVIYRWTDKNEIIIEYYAITDRKTVLNVTNHAYFNLHGAGIGDILDHVLTIRAASFTPIDSLTMPTGEILPVAGTPLDFNTPHSLGERIGDNFKQLKIAGGYDHNYVLDNKAEVDAEVYDPVSGRKLEVITDQPGIQLYTANGLKGKAVGHGGKPYNYRSGFCLEAEHFPDSPNHPNFPTTILNAGETFKSVTIYRFSVK
jgi:aldose 1-epimerase